jgi:hypothetical protein
MRVTVLSLLVACGSSTTKPPPASSPDARSPDASTPDAPAAIVDDDGDGLDDAQETALAIAYMPFVSLNNDSCALDGMLVRVRPHPADATKILIVYDHLFLADCGLNGHPGDDEVFGVSIDPAIPPPGGIVGIRAVSHQNTPCERDTECSTCAGDSRPACDVASDGGAMWPVVYSSKDKHGNYATLAQCPVFGTCLDECSLDAHRARPPVANAGEPLHHLIDDLTTQGFITAAGGWTEPSLMHFDPWDPVHDFGGAGNLASDLVDAAFVAAPCAH